MRTGRYVVFASVLAALVAASPSEARLAPHVAGAQVALRAHGLYQGPIDGLLGPRTRHAVLTFQRRQGIAVDGVVGPQTRARLGRLGRPLLGRRLVRPGMVGWDVSVLQFLLSRRGVGVGIDGVYGRATQQAVRRFQSRAALAVDGIVGPATTRALARGAPGRRAAASGVAGAGRPRIRAMLGHWARHYGVSPSLVRALAWVESGFHSNLTSPSGAWGVMQVMPATWRFVEDVLTGRDFRRTPRDNIRVGIIYLRHLLRHYGGNRRLALAAYYQGPSSVRRHGLYRDTRRYVRAVLALERRI
jgi:Transglycosylase SLT domain/Putative peptidoglycan binding domain